MVGAIRLKKDEDRRLRRGHLWVFSNEIDAIDVDAPGGLVHVYDKRGKLLGSAYANPHSLITARMLSTSALPALDVSWWRHRLEVALARRQGLYAEPYYRWVHGEGDMLPGLIIDRFGDDIVIQAHTAGVDCCLPEVGEAVAALLSPRNIYAKNSVGVRRLEGLPLENRVLFGDGDGGLCLVEGGVSMHCRALTGQKTGYFYDQRPNRAFIAGLASGARVLDLCCYVGAFAAQCLAHGAEEVLSVDSSAEALGWAERNIGSLVVAGRWQGVEADVMNYLPVLLNEGRRFDIVICDPPAFVKGRKSIKAGLAGYQNLNQLAARLVNPGGLLFTASCSGLVEAGDFARAVSRGLHGAGRRGTVIHEGGAGPDHPWLLAMPETRYLKTLTLRLD